MVIAVQAPLKAALAALIMVAASPPLAGAAENIRDYCRFGTRSSAFLVDRTTRYDEHDQRVIVDSLTAVVESLGPGDRIYIATIGEHYSGSQRVFNECRPGCPETRNPLGDIATGCASLLATRDRRAFMNRLRQRVSTLLSTASEASHSDITGTIAQTMRRPPGGRAFAHLYIYSDMLENSQALPWTRFRDQTPEQSMAIADAYGLTPALANAEVRIVGFGRLHDTARTPLNADLDLRLRAFWRAYFRRGGARAVEFEGTISN